MLTGWVGKCDIKLFLSLAVASDDEEIYNIEIHRSGGGFGFSIRGGAEYNSALCVLRIADGGAAAQDGRLKVLKEECASDTYIIDACVVCLC